MKINYYLISIAFFFCLLTACTKKVPVKTVENLKKAIKDESLLCEKNHQYSIKAATDGHYNIARLFGAVSKAESIHVSNFNAILFKFSDLFEITSDTISANYKNQSIETIENLKDAIGGGMYKLISVYPFYIEIARKERSVYAVHALTWALESEKKYAVLFQEALSILNETGVDERMCTSWNVCPKCGNIHKETDDFVVCEVCGVSRNKFVLF